MTTSLSDDFDFGEILENLNNKIDIDFDNVKDKQAVIAKILSVLGFSGGDSYSVLSSVRDEDNNVL